MVAAIIVREDGRILIARRPEGSRQAGKWEFPGGKVEPGEDPRDALVRECREELGCAVEAGAHYETVAHDYPTHSVVLKFFVARVLSGEPRPMEANALAWATPDEMEMYDLLEADRPFPAKFRLRPPAF